MSHSNHEKSASSEHSPWEHLVHYAHFAHLSAEMAERAAHLSHQMDHVVAAQKLVRTHAQMALDIARMQYHVSKLEAVFKAGGDAGYTAGWRLIRARGALGSAWLAYKTECPAVKAAGLVLMKSSPLRFGVAAGITPKVGRALPRLESALRGSQIGSKLLSTGKIVTSKVFTHALLLVGAAYSAVEAYRDSPAETPRGKVTNAILGGGAGALTMANPVVAGLDLVLPKGYKPGELFRGTAAALTAIDEAFSPDGSNAMEKFHSRSKDGEYGKAMQEASGAGEFFADAPPAIAAVIRRYDTKPLDDVHKRSMDGAYGRVLQAASEAGDFWAVKSVQGGLHEFADSVRWWVSH